MADDIDIEEHNVLENPRVKRIFPDLSILKKEINDSSDYGHDKSSQRSNSQVLGSQAITTVSEQNQKPCFSQFSKKISENKIILGTKHRNREQISRSHIKKAKVCLQNISTFLNNNEKFCKTCLILFPSKECLNTHHTIVHSSVSIDQQTVNEIKGNNIKQKIKCQKCNMTFVNYGNLNRHKQNIHSHNEDLKNKVEDNRIAGENVMVKVNESNVRALNENNLEECFHCEMTFPTQQLLIDHLYEVLNSRRTHVAPGRTGNEDSAVNKTNKTMGINHIEVGQKSVENDNEITHVSIFRCPVCTYCFNEWDFYEAHLIKKHEVTKVKRTSKVPFEPYCKYCRFHYSSCKSYNVHLHKRHKSQILQKVRKQCTNTVIKTNNFKKTSLMFQNKEQMSQRAGRINNKTQFDNTKQIGMNIEKVKSINNQIKVMAHKTFLFKCSQCNIHFLTNESAINHYEHSSLHDSNCTICQRLFKVKDINLHLEQHKYSNFMSVVAFNGTNGKKMLNRRDAGQRILHKCPSCAIHFSKKQFIAHYSACEKEQSQSYYCKVCDILVSDDIKSSHDKEHDINNLKSSDFKIVELNKLGKRTFQKTKGRQKSSKMYGEKGLFHLMCCNFCKCNVLRDHYKTTIHLQSRCLHFIKYVCKYCGLVFSNKSINNHRKLHQKYSNLSLKDFTFYDLKTNEKVLPSVPVFPKCDSCEKHFITKFEVRRHVCHLNNYLTCPTCDMKLSQTAYRLHTPFHELVLNNGVICVNENSITPDKVSLASNLPATSGQVSDVGITVIFTCNNCVVSFDSYDEAIEHCHLHSDLNEINIDTIECGMCKLKFDTTRYEEHQKIHQVFPEGAFTYLKFDVYHFGARNEKWLKHMLGSMSQDIMNEMLKNSIYKHETRVKMRIQRNGSDGTVYKCENCQSTIETNAIYEHTKTCKTHSNDSVATDDDYCHSGSQIRVVAFNGKEDDNFNDRIANIRKCYVLYECRSCHVVVDRKYENHSCGVAHRDCYICGLLLNELDYAVHVAKHKLISSFNVNLIKVILLGSKPEKQSLRYNGSVTSRFSGIVCDYTFYKCLNCEVCVRDYRNTFQHYCLIDAAKSKCPTCDLVFDEGKLKGHLKLHDSDPYLIKDTILVQTFDNKLKGQVKNIEKSQNNLTGPGGINFSNIEDEDSKSNFEKTINIYKCVCGLHYITEPTVQTHMKKCSGKIKLKQSKQNCSKCCLTFSPDVLFKHLIEHHGNKDVIFKYEIINLTPASVLDVCDEQNEMNTDSPDSQNQISEKQSEENSNTSAAD